MDKIAIFMLIILFNLFIFAKPLEKLINDKKPRIQFEAKVLKVDDRRSGQFYNGRLGGYNLSPRYRILFEFSDEKRKQKSVSSPEYKWVKVGDEGILTLQGTRFISFEKEKSE